MINVVDRYFSLNRILLLVVGLWPYEKSKFTGLKIIAIFSILITCIIFQLTTMLSSKCSPQFIIKILSPVVPLSAFIVKYNSFCVNSKTVKYLMEQIQHVYSNIKDNNEIAIIERYGSKAKRYTAVITMAILFGALAIASAQLLPGFIDIVLSANVSRSRHLQISTEYFIDEEKYFYLLAFHINVALFVGSFAVAATGTMLVAYLQHVCGMFKIASYRIERAIQIYMLKSINLQNGILAYKGIIRAVAVHRKAMMFSTCLISSFEITFMLLIVIGVLSLSLNIFRVFQIALSGQNTHELLINFSIACICVLYMFVANFIGQQIIDHNNHLFVTVYKVQWYVTPLYIQKLMVFLLLKSNKNFGLNVGGLFIASIECFATLINAAVSYFTLMYSVR